MAYPHVVRVTPQIRIASPVLISSWSVMIVYQVALGATRNVISFPFRITICLLIDLVLRCGVSLAWVVHLLIAPVNPLVRWNLWMRSAASGHSESVYKYMLLVLLEERFLREAALEVCLQFFPKEQGRCRWLWCKLCCLLFCLTIFSIFSAQGFVRWTLAFPQWSSTATIIVRGIHWRFQTHHAMRVRRTENVQPAFCRHMEYVCKHLHIFLIVCSSIEFCS